jgi:hypothetical protein
VDLFPFSNAEAFQIAFHTKYVVLKTGETATNQIKMFQVAANQQPVLFRENLAALGRMSNTSSETKFSKSRNLVGERIQNRPEYIH